MAGFWYRWMDRNTGEEHDSMLTLGADGHPLMGLMHKHVVEYAQTLLKLAPAEVFDAEPDREEGLIEDLLCRGSP
jgi:hypothetical protein